MKYNEFRRQLGKAGLSVKDFAALMKQNPKSISNYSKFGKVPTHMAVISALLAELAENSIDFRATLSKIEIEPSLATVGSPKGKFGGNKQQIIKFFQEKNDVFT